MKRGAEIKTGDMMFLVCFRRRAGTVDGDLGPTGGRVVGLFRAASAALSKPIQADPGMYTEGSSSTGDGATRRWQVK
jgi:hypothetical protein